MDNFVFSNPKIPDDNIQVYNARQKPFAVHGLYKPELPGLFRRMPTDVAEKVSPAVQLLHTNTSGGRLRFVTDSTYIALGAVYPDMEFFSPLTAAKMGAGAFSFDLYADGKHIKLLQPAELFHKGCAMAFALPGGHYEAFSALGGKKLRQITLCFPGYVNVEEVYIGLQPGAQVEEAPAYPNEKPVVFYGSSITQGACASRPGNMYANILSRKLNFDYINLGFASGCKAEDAMIDYLCSLDMGLLVFDYDHNTPSYEHLQSTHLPALRKLRAAHPDIPFIVMSRPDQDCGEAETLRRCKLIEENCRILAEESTAPVYFINGQDIFYSRDREMMTLDGTHPTDFGFYCIADALYETMYNLISDNHTRKEGKL